MLPITLVHDHHPGLGNNLDIEGALGESWALVTETANVQATLNKKRANHRHGIRPNGDLEKGKGDGGTRLPTSKSQNWIKNTRTNLSSWRNTSIQPGVAKGVELGTTLEEYQPFKELFGK